MILPRGSPLIRKKKKGTVHFACLPSLCWQVHLPFIAVFFCWCQNPASSPGLKTSDFLRILQVVPDWYFKGPKIQWLGPQSSQNEIVIIWQPSLKETNETTSLSLSPLPLSPPTHTHTYYVTLWNYSPSAHELLVTLWIIHGSVRSHITFECMYILIYFLYREEAAVISAQFLVICLDY